jgi:hypothetical protein
LPLEWWDAHPSLRQRLETHSSRQLQTRKPDNTCGIDSGENLKGAHAKSAFFMLSTHWLIRIVMNWCISKNIKMGNWNFTATHRGRRNQKVAGRWDAVIVFARRRPPAGDAEKRATRMKVTARTRHWRHKSKQIIYRSSKPGAVRRAPGAWKKRN